MGANQTILSLLDQTEDTPEYVQEHYADLAKSEEDAVTVMISRDWRRMLARFIKLLNEDPENHLPDRYLLMAQAVACESLDCLAYLTDELPFPRTDPVDPLLLALACDRRRAAEFLLKDGVYHKSSQNPFPTYLRVAEARGNDTAVEIIRTQYASELKDAAAGQ